MLYFFVGAMLSLVSLFLVGRFELAHQHRLGGNARRVVERRLEQILRAFQRRTQDVVVFIQRDLLIKLLHALSYVALVTVRYLERRLVMLTQFFRTHRRREQVPTKLVRDEPDVREGETL